MLDNALVLNFHYDTAHVIAAIRANRVRWDSRAASLTVLNLFGLNTIVRPAAPCAGIRLSSLWYGHLAILAKNCAYISDKLPAA